MSISLQTKEKVLRSSKYRWLIWGIMVASYAIVYFHSASMGIVKDTLMKEFAVSEAVIISIGNVYFYLYLLMQVPTGILVDTLGSRYTAFLGTLIAGIGITIFSYASSVLGLYLGRALVGLGTAVIFVSIVKILSQWFEQSESATLIGLTCFIGVLGGAVAQTPLALMVDSIGWRVSFRVIGAVSVFIAVLIYLFVRNKPEELGFQSMNQVAPAGGSEDKINVFTSLKKVFLNPKTWPVFFMYAAFYGTYVILTGYYGTPFIAEVYELSMIEASKYIIFAIIGAAFGSVVVGAASDRLKSRKKPLIVVGLIYVLAWGALVFLNNGMPPRVLLIPLLFIMGFSSCAYVVSWSAVGEVNDPRAVGISSAVANIGGFFGPIVLPPMLAMVFVRYGDSLSSAELYQRAFMIAFIATVLGFIASLFTKETGCKNIYKES